jgi:hypothetical protein
MSNVIVKNPFLASTSGWQPNVVWKNSSIPLAGGICRASLGLWLQDEVFPDYWKQWEDMGIVRSAYHFHKIGYSTADQAEFFVGCLYDAGGWKVGDKLCLDIEESRGDDLSELSIGGVVDFFYNVKLLTGLDYDQFLIYSRMDIMNALSFSKLSQAQKDILLRIKTWPAGYLNDPNPYGFADLKKFYQFDPLRYGECVLVQYAASVEIPGINPIEGRSTECNVADPSYLMVWMAETGTQPPPDPDPEPGETTMIEVGKVNTGLNIRSTPDSSSADNILGKLQSGDVVQATEITATGWWKLLKITRGNMNVALPAADCYSFQGATSGYIQWLTVVEVAAPPAPGELPTVTIAIDGGEQYQPVAPVQLIPK